MTDENEAIEEIDENDEVAAEREALDRLAATLDEQERQLAYRWVWVAAFGTAAVATAPLLLRRVGPGPVGTVGGAGLPVLVWIGVAVMGVALAVAAAGPHRETVDDALGVLGGAVVAGIGVIDPLRASGVGPAPWLALAGALVAGSAALGRIVTLTAAGRRPPPGRDRDR